MRISNIFMAAMGGLALMLSSCKDIFNEDCNYLSYIRAEIQPDSLMSQVPLENFTMVTYAGENPYFPTEWKFGSNGSILADVHTGHVRNGNIKLLFFNGTDYTISNIENFDEAEIGITPVIDEQLGIEVLHSPRIPAGFASDNIQTVTEDTVYVKKEIKSMMQELKVKVYILNAELFPDFKVERGLIGGTSSGKKMADGTITRKYYPTVLNFKTEGGKDSLYHSLPAEPPASYTGKVATASIYTFGTIGAPRHELQLMLDYGPEKATVSMDMDEILSTWDSTNLELPVMLLLGESLEDLRFEPVKWKDGINTEIEVTPDN